MNRNFARSLCLLVPALCLGVLSASAGTIFSDLGAGNAYQCCTGWTVSGTGTIGTSFTAANVFNSGLGGSVSQIDLAVGSVAPPNTFYASIWTDVGGLPGAEVSGAFWGNLLATTVFGNCCGVTTVSGISGVTLAASTDYFMILGPMSITDTSWNAWNWNSVGATGLDLYSTDGGTTWNSNGTQTIGAFDVLGSSTPEPASILLLGVGLASLGVIRRKMSR